MHLDDPVPEQQRLRLSLPAGDALARPGRRLPERRARVVVVARVSQALERRGRLLVAAEPEAQGHAGVERRRVPRRDLQRAAQRPGGRLGIDEPPGQIEPQPQLAAARPRLPLDETLELRGRELRAAPHQPRQALLGDRRPRIGAGRESALDRAQRLAPPPELPLQHLRLRPVSGRLVGRVGQRLPQVPQRGGQLLAAPEALEQPDMLGDRLHVGRVEPERPRRRGQGLLGAPEPERIEARRLDLVAAGAGGVRLAGRLPGQHRGKRVEPAAPVMRPRQARQDRTRVGLQRQRRLVGADRLVVGGRALFEDHPRPVAPSEPRRLVKRRDLGAQFQRRLRRHQRVPCLLRRAQERRQRRPAPRAERDPLTVERQRLAGIAQTVLVQRAQSLEPDGARPRVGLRPRLAERARGGGHVDDLGHLVPAAERRQEPLEQVRRRGVPGDRLQRAPGQRRRARQIVRRRLGQLGRTQGQRRALGGVRAAIDRCLGQGHLGRRVAGSRGDPLERGQRHRIAGARLEQPAVASRRRVVIPLVQLGDVRAEAEQRRRPVAIARQIGLPIERLARLAPFAAGERA